MDNLKTYKLYGIIGCSLRHSLSPVIHNYLFKKYKLDCCYTVFESNESKLKDVVGSIRSLNIFGANVTYPYKENIIPFLDDLDKTAQKTGAVNTIKNSRGKLIGYNTDIIGIQKTIQNKLKTDIKDKTVLLLGAGGAARACLVELIRQKPNKIIVTSRDVSKAKIIIQNLKNDLDIIAIDINDLHALDQLDQLALLINSTSAKYSFLIRIIKVLSKQKLISKTKIFDLNYGQRAVPKKLQKYPNRYVDGLYMLAAQAAASFNIWTGIKVEPDDIYKYMTRKLQDNKYA